MQHPTPKFLQTRLTTHVFHIASYIMLFMLVIPRCSCSRKSSNSNPPGLENDAIYNVSVCSVFQVRMSRIAHWINLVTGMQRTSSYFIRKVYNITVYAGQLLRHISRQFKTHNESPSGLCVCSISKQGCGRPTASWQRAYSANSSHSSGFICMAEVSSMLFTEMSPARPCIQS